MINLGDFQAGATVNFKFNTYSFVDGSPATLGGTPAVLVYKGTSTTESSSTGITLTVDFDSRTGMHHVSIDTSANSSFFVAGNDFQIVITTGTVGGVSVVGAVIAYFSIQNRVVDTQTVRGKKWVIPGTVTGSPTTTSVNVTVATDLATGMLNGMSVTISDEANGFFQRRKITSHTRVNGTTATLAFSGSGTSEDRALASAPATTATVLIH